MEFTYQWHTNLLTSVITPSPAPGNPYPYIPPVHLVAPQGNDYACQPTPSHRSSPWGPKIFMKFCYPEASGKYKSTAIPKENYYRGRLRYRGDDRGIGIGIGCGFGSFPPSLSLGILWAVFRLFRGI